MSMFVYQINKDRFLIICNPLTRCTWSPCSFSLKFFAFAINFLTSSRFLRLLSGPIRRFLILSSASFNFLKFFIISFTSFSLSKDTSSGLFVVASSFFFPSRTKAVLFPISTDARNVSISCLSSTFLLCPSWLVLSSAL